MKSNLYYFTVIFLDNIELRFRSITKSLNEFKSKVINYCRENYLVDQDEIRFISIKRCNNSNIFGLDVIEI